MTSKRSTLQAAWTAGKLAGRRVLGRKEGARDVELGKLLTGQLDEMKGLAMKIGQIVSYMDVPLPESVQQELSRLQTGMCGLSEDETRSALAAALGEDYRARFEQFNLQPIAAASIGQVHRARVAGRDIALKLQYPNVAASFREDLGAVNRIASLASLASAVDGRAIVRELALRLEEECDYAREGSFQQKFKRAFANDPEVHIPSVLSAFTTRATLASHWADGQRFEQACRAPRDLRRTYATTLVRFSYRSLLELATVQADPHPGNFLFGPAERVTFLDFGCVRVLDVDFVQLLRLMVRAIDTGDRSAFRDVVIALGMAPKPKRFDFEHHFLVMEHLHRPLLQDRFEITSAFIREGLAYNGPQSPNARHMAFPPEQVWVARLQWGLWSVLSRLGVSLCLRETLDAVMDAPITPLMEMEPCPEPSPSASERASSSAFTT
jgi:predicted unusual protein kinase regulating ubiquinone biosynthesis (AarF/ABC1/UbiB family)